MNLKQSLSSCGAIALCTLLFFAAIVLYGNAEAEKIDYTIQETPVKYTVTAAVIDCKAEEVMTADALERRYTTVLSIEGEEITYRSFIVYEICKDKSDVILEYREGQEFTGYTYNGTYMPQNTLS